ncbi:hypothetical protein [Azospirillum sp.]|uniref:hypothetical protein n=1 Tax=Azospirillum sp. TaxID=34012 RepID=UPI003D70FF9B
MLITVPTHLLFNLVNDLDGEWAVKVRNACFREGAEDEIRVDFFRLWGRVLRRSYNRHTTITTHHFVDGDDLDLFNTYYPQGAE